MVDEQEAQAPEEPRTYNTVVEFANRLGTNRRTIYRWIREGVMKADTSNQAEFKISFEEADRIAAMWDMEKKRLKKEKTEVEEG